MLVKILGGIDILSATAFLMLMFGIQPAFYFLIFCSGLLLVKGMFIFTGEIILSLVDLISAVLLLLSIFLAIPAVLLWIPSLLLLAKGFVSFV